MAFIYDNVVAAQYEDGLAQKPRPIKAANAGTVSDNTAAVAALEASTAALANGIRTITASATAVTTDKTVLANAAAAAITVTLPPAASSSARIMTVKKIDASANTVTIDPNGSETIDGAATKVISAQWTAVRFQCDGTAWFII